MSQLVQDPALRRRELGSRRGLLSVRKSGAVGAVVASAVGLMLPVLAAAPPLANGSDTAALVSSDREPKLPSLVGKDIEHDMPDKAADHDAPIAAVLCENCQWGLADAGSLDDTDAAPVFLQRPLSEAAMRAQFVDCLLSDNDEDE